MRRLWLRRHPGTRRPGRVAPRRPPAWAQMAGQSGRLGRMRLSRLTMALLALAVTGCASGGVAPAPQPGGPARDPIARRLASTAPAAAPAAWDWPNYHRDAAHTGYAPGTPPAGLLAIAWRRRLNGAVYGQPLAIAGLIIAATEGDSLFGLDRATGQVRWRVHVGTPVPLSALPCGDIDPLGITSTPVYDPATRTRLRGRRNDRLPPRAGRGERAVGTGRIPPRHPHPGRSIPSSTSSAVRSPWPEAGSTSRLAAWPGTAGRTAARWSVYPCPATGR